MEKFSAGAVGEDFSDPVKSFIRLVQCPWIWGVVTFSLLQLFFWIKILRQTDLSVAYPISSLFFPLAMLASVFVFHEHVSWLAYTGSLLIATGIFFVGSGENTASAPHPELSIPAVRGEVVESVR
jgi:drug/metabolite transporter (DMT)-like permease